MDCHLIVKKSGPNPTKNQLENGSLKRFSTVKNPNTPATVAWGGGQGLTAHGYSGMKARAEGEDLFIDHKGPGNINNLGACF